MRPDRLRRRRKDDPLFVRIIRSTVMISLWLLLVGLPWMLNQLSRFDPIGPSGWHTLSRHPAAEPESPHSTSFSASPRRGRHLRSVVLLGLLTLLVLTAAPRTHELASFLWEQVPNRGFRLDTTTQGNGLTDYPIRDRVPDDLEASAEKSTDVPAAMVDSDWFNHSNSYNSAQGWAIDPSTAWRPVNPYRLLDFSSEYLNIVDGKRLSWTPPACDCQRLKVWMYGGSTTYGLNQRDEHTIASEIARTAFDHGISIDIDNRGAMGHLHWMEAERFAWDLTIEDPPDMVVFYDGVNEVWAASTLNIVGAGDIKPMRDPTTFDLWRKTGRADGPPPKRPADARIVGTRTDISLAPGQLQEVMLARYDRARTLSRAAAEQHGVDVRYIWQPTRFSRPLVPSEPHASGRTENLSRASEQYARTLLADDVIDVSDALRSTAEPLFTDDVHHNEKASRLVAAEIWRRIGPDLETMFDHANG